MKLPNWRMALAWCLVGVGVGVGAAHAATAVGQLAPTFTLSDTSGKSVSLSDFKGKTVVLEWVNPGCPFVQKHYKSANLPNTQKAAVERAVVWLAVNSTAPGTTDHLSAQAMADWMTQHHSAASATLLDADGRVGRAYGAKTTPHMYIIDPRGVLVYAGAIDSKPTAKVDDIKSAVNYVSQALGELQAGKPVSTPVTQAYGCTVKYAGG